MDTPKPGPSGSSSEDLERAKQLSKALRGAQPAAPGTVTPAYVSFGQLKAPAAAPAPAPSASRPSQPLLVRREPVKAPSGGFGPGAWNRLLDASVAAVGAEAAFLMDPHGLIVSARGPGVSEELEGTGARLMAAFDQADRIGSGHSTLSMTVETPRGTLHGLRLAQPDASFLTLAIVVGSGLTAERLARLMTLVNAATATEPVGER